MYLLSQEFRDHVLTSWISKSCSPAASKVLSDLVQYLRGLNPVCSTEKKSPLQGVTVFWVSTPVLGDLTVFCTHLPPLLGLQSNLLGLLQTNIQSIFKLKNFPDIYFPLAAGELEGLGEWNLCVNFHSGWADKCLTPSLREGGWLGASDHAEQILTSFSSIYAQQNSQRKQEKWESWKKKNKEKERKRKV